MVPIPAPPAVKQAAEAAIALGVAEADVWRLCGWPKRQRSDPSPYCARRIQMEGPPEIVPPAHVWVIERLDGRAVEPRVLDAFERLVDEIHIALAAASAAAGRAGQPALVHEDRARQ